MEEWYDPNKATFPLRMPKKFELEAYLSLSDQQLLSLLKTGTTTQVFRGLAALSLRNLNNPIFHLPENQALLRHIAAEGFTFKNRKLAYNLYGQLYPDQLDQLALGDSKQIGYVYFIREMKYGSTKIGRSQRLDQRLCSFVTDLPYRVEWIGAVRSLNYEKIELNVHRHFRRQRLGGEWFELTDQQIDDLRQHRFPKEIEALIVPE